MRLLDLFCGAGGAGMGYHLAGFDEIVGVDIDPQPDYPFDFVQADALDIWWAHENWDLIHASPPCQRFSSATLNPDDWPDLVDPVRQAIKATNTPYVLENVPGAPMRPDVTLCGSMFGLSVRRHRIFELDGWFVWNPPVCNHDRWNTPHGRPWTVTGDLHGTEQVYPHSAKPSKHDAAEIMGMPWVTNTRGIVEAIPPAYTQFFGSQFIEHVERVA